MENINYQGQGLINFLFALNVWTHNWKFFCSWGVSSYRQLLPSGAFTSAYITNLSLSNTFLVLVILANIYRWLSLLTKHSWESRGIKSHVYAISYARCLCGRRVGMRRRLTIIPVNPMWWIAQERSTNGAVCLMVSMDIF